MVKQDLRKYRRMAKKEKKTKREDFSQAAVRVVSEAMERPLGVHLEWRIPNLPNTSSNFPESTILVNTEYGSLASPAFLGVSEMYRTTIFFALEDAT